jgi:hypothetical protein
MITHNNYNYFYYIHIVFLHWTQGGFATISTNLSTVPWCPLQQNNILLNIASITQSSNTAAHTLLVNIN